MFEQTHWVLAQGEGGGDGSFSSLEGPSESVAGDGAVTAEGGGNVEGQPLDGAPGAGAGAGGGGGGGAGGFGDPTMLILLVGMFAAMIFFSWRAQKKERNQREALLGSIKKGDKVQTVGGMIGSIAELREDEVVLKVDESANTRIRFARSAVTKVIESKGNKGEAAAT